MRWWSRRTWAHFFQRTRKASTTYIVTHSENNLKTSRTSLSQLKYKKPHKNGRKGRDQVGSQNLGKATHKWERFHRHGDLPWGARGSSPTLGSSHHGDLHGKMNPMMPRFENQWGLAPGEHWAIGNWDSPLKGPVQNINHSEIQHRCRSLKSTQYLCEDLPTKFWVCAQGEGSCKNFLWDWKCSWRLSSNTPHLPCYYYSTCNNSPCRLVLPRLPALAGVWANWLLPCQTSRLL